MERFVAVVKQYPGQQQVDLAVEIEVPGSWFGAGPMGSLTLSRSKVNPGSPMGQPWVPDFWGATVGSRTKIVNRGSPRPVFSFACAGQPDQIVNL